MGFTIHNAWKDVQTGGVYFFRCGRQEFLTPQGREVAVLDADGHSVASAAEYQGPVFDHQVKVSHHRAPLVDTRVHRAVFCFLSETL